MGVEHQELIAKIKFTLEQLLLGKFVDPIEERSDSGDLNEIVEMVNILEGNLKEMADFAHSLSKGSLNVPPPGRRNYLASSLKELHSQLSGFVWSAQQLEKGRVVDKSDYSGELSLSLNALIDSVAARTGLIEPTDTDQDDESIDSWKYHQVLLAFHHLRVMVIMVDQEGRVVFSNRPAGEHLKNLTHLRAQDVTEATSPLLKSVAAHSNDANTFPAFQELYDNSVERWYKITSDQIIFPNGAPIYIHSIEDISAWKSNETKLRISATVDNLTNVYNRNVGLKSLQKALESSSKSCAAFLDLDGLKTINDSFGHNEGDYAIRAIAEILLTSVRDTDTVSRFGGDEFLIVFPGCTTEAAERIMMRMQTKLDAINALNFKPYTLSFSYGITEVDPQKDSVVEELIMLMDQRMYERKKNKKKQMQVKKLS